MQKTVNRKKLFIENFLVYGLGSIISKIVPIIMLPIITSIMRDSSYYGINDMVNLVISFASAIAIMGVYDALFRMFFEKDDLKFKKQLCSSALFFVFISGIIISLIMIIFRHKILHLISNNLEYNYLILIVIVNTFLSGFSSIASAPTRMENKRRVFLVINFISPILSYSISIPMLLKGMYVYALPVSALISVTITTIIFFILNREWFSIKYISKSIIIDLLKIGVPLMPTFLMYWVCNSMDRVMIKSILGLGELGVYSVAYKISSMSQLIYTAFSMGWQYFVFSTMKDKDQKEMIGKITNILLTLSVISTVGVAIFSKVIFNILAKGNYNNGYILLPYLFIAPLLLMVFQTMSNQFLVIKKSIYIPIILSSAVIGNLILNYALINKIGIEGAAIATMLSYIISVFICYAFCIRKKILERENNIVINIVLLLVYLLIWRITIYSNIMAFIIGIILVIILLFINRDLLKYIVKNN